MKLEQIKRSFIYRYVVYRMHQHEKKSISLRAVSNQEKEELYERVSRQVIRATLLFAPLYFVGVFLFSYNMWLGFVTQSFLLMSLFREAGVILGQINAGLSCKLFGGYCQ